MLTSTFPPELVDRVVAESGRTQQRQRLLPARVVVWLVLAMALFSGQAYEEVARLLAGGLGGGPTLAAVVQGALDAGDRQGPRPAWRRAAGGGCLSRWPGQSLESAAEDVNRMGKQQQTDEQKKEMLKRLQELREVLRQQGKGGKEQMDRMQRFGERARGGGKQPGQNGKPGTGSQPGQLRLSRGQSDGPGIEVRCPAPPPAGRLRSEGNGQPGGEPGKGHGTGHDANLPVIRPSWTARPKT